MNNEQEIFTLQFLLPISQESRLREWSEQHSYATWPNWGGHITLVNIFEPHLTSDRLCDLISEKSRLTEPFKIFFNQLVVEPHRVHRDLYTVYLTHPSQCNDDCNRLKEFQRELISLLQPQVKFRQKELENHMYRQHLSLTWGLTKPQALELYQQARDWKLELWSVLDCLSLLKVEEREQKQWEMNIYRQFSLKAKAEP